MDLTARQEIRSNTKILAVESRSRGWSILNGVRRLLDWLQNPRLVVHVESRVLVDGRIVDPHQLAALLPGDTLYRIFWVAAPFDEFDRSDVDGHMLDADAETLELTYGARAIARESLHSGHYINN